MTIVLRAMPPRSAPEKDYASPRWLSPQPCHFPCLPGSGRADARQVLAYQLGNVRRGEMRVVLLCHSGVRVAEGGSHNLQRDAGFREKTRVAVAEDMERDGRVNFRVQACLTHGTVLM